MSKAIRMYIDKTVYQSPEPYFNEKVLDKQNAGFDLKICSVYKGSAKPENLIEPSKNGEYWLMPNLVYTINTGIKMELPPEYTGLMSLRSSAMRGGMRIPGIGVIDPNYRGFVYAMVSYLPPETMYTGKEIYVIKQYDRLVQMLVLKFSKTVEFVDDENALSETERGALGFGGYTSAPSIGLK